ncbi:hypothetical protein CVT24_009947 [Panaeolus cyanescens]|uniref:Uncharacterized protein n=1 Tax=Panaeolus cyanescens TaxID=181874 RepID=A0A409VXL4_9AGAR|nr:hypothetical protein CVT24_009947 [Panaeolus cyanescens]
MAGPAISVALQRVIEEQIHAKLQGLSHSLGEIVQEASRLSEYRKLKRRGRGRESKDGALNVLGDFWNALLEVGPQAFGYDKNEKRDKRTESSLEATSRGLVYTSKQVVTEQPRGTPSMTMDPATGTVTKVDLTMEDIGGPQGRVVEGEETVVAVGLGGQLFPDQLDTTASYGAAEDGDSRRLGEGVRDAAGGAQQVAGHVGDRWAESSRRESNTAMKTWRSKAFDLD